MCDGAADSHGKVFGEYLLALCSEYSLDNLLFLNVTKQKRVM